MDPRTVILCYHRVSDDPFNPYALCVSPANFARQIEYLRKHFEIVTLDEIDRPSRRQRVVLTFDDGYVDNLVNALPIAESFQVPFAVYVTTGLIGRPEGFWWDRLARVLLPQGAATSEATAAQRARLMEEQRRLRPKPAQEIADEMAAIERNASTPLQDAELSRPMTAAELAELAASQFVTIGAHTTDHVNLSTQPEDVQLETMQASKADLEHRLATSVEHFAYPFGGHDAVNPGTIELARGLGFKTGVTTIPGSVRAASDRLGLRRRLVMNWSLPRWRLQVARWGLR